MSTFSLRESPSQHREGAEAAIRHEATYYGIDPELAVELATWGSLDIANDHWELTIVKGNDVEINVRFDRNRHKGDIYTTDKMMLKPKTTSQMYSIPVSKVGLADAKNVFNGEVFDEQVLFFVIDLGILGDMSIGVTKEGNLRFRNNLKTN